jgi:uncharacterized membrane protein
MNHGRWGSGGGDDGSFGYGGGSGGPWERGAPWGGRERGRGWGGGRGFFGGMMFLRAIFERLDTTPGQEKVIRAAFEDFRERAKAIKDELKDARPEIARAFRSEVFDETSVGGAVAHLEIGLEGMRKAMIEAFAKVHEVLDERQRGMIADIVEKRGFSSWRNGDWRGGGSPYRDEWI